MSRNLYIEFKKGHKVVPLEIWQTPTILTKQILGDKLEQKVFTPMNFEHDFLEPYVKFFNGKINIDEYKQLWFKNRGEFWNGLKNIYDINEYPGIEESEYYIYQYPPKPTIMFGLIINPENIYHFNSIKNKFNKYIKRNYNCIGYAL